MKYEEWYHQITQQLCNRFYFECELGKRGHDGEEDEAYVGVEVENKLCTLVDIMKYELINKLRITMDHKVNKQTQNHHTTRTRSSTYDIFSLTIPNDDNHMRYR
eukprot:88482_1